MNNYNKKIYYNKVFSYNQVNLNQRNYSRKNFANTYNKSVKFNDCLFHQTIFNTSKFENCIFKNCTFRGFEFSNVMFENVIFSNCSFTDILFSKCKFQSVKFNSNKYVNIYIYPYQQILGLDINDLSSNNISIELKKILEEARLQKYIRESNTIFKKKKNRIPNSTKKHLKRLTKKDGDKLGYTKKQRLLENARRKKERNKLLKQSYENSQLGKNRKLDIGILNFLLIKYSENELIEGLRYSIDHIKSPFSQLSYLMKYIDEGNTKYYNS